MSTRPKPKPKPRPRVAPDVPLPSPGDPITSLPAVSPLEPAIINVEDDDALFLRNRNRTLETWKRLEKLSEAQEKKKKSAKNDASDEDDDAPRPRKYKKVEKNDNLPSWTRNPRQVLLSDDDEDDDVVEVLDAKPSSSSPRKHRLAARNSRRQRSRSRSLTPPPELPSYALQHARETVRRLLGTGRRAASPTLVGEESMGDIELDPELASIAKQVKSKMQRQSSAHPGSRGSSPVPAVGGPENVLLKVRWKKHPLDPNGKSDVWGIQMKRDQPFKALYDEVADSAEVLAHNVVIIYEGKRIYATSTPHGVGIWASAELEACDKSTLEYLQTHRHHSPTPGTLPGGVSDGRARSPAASEGDFAPPSDADSDDEDTLKINIQSASMKTLPLTVRKTTKVGAIVQAFLKHHGLTAQYASPVKGQGKKGKNKASGPALVVDGEKLSPDDEIGASELDDGDMVEIVGL